jgi:phosphoribosylanthranilate isomerase
MKVKVCGMRNRENIREITACKPDLLGFIFYPSSKRYVGEKFDPRLLRKIPPYIYKVGVFVNESPEKIVQLIERYNLDMVQLHGDEDVNVLSELKAKKISIIKSFHINEQFDFNLTEPYLPYCDFFLFDSKSDSYGGAGVKFSWAKLEKYTFQKPFFLSGGIGIEDIESIRAIKHSGLYGVDINSRFEISDGYKDVFLVGDFINKVKQI